MMMRLQSWRVLFPGPLWSRDVVPVKVPSIAQKEHFKNYLYSIGLVKVPSIAQKVPSIAQKEHFKNYLY